MMFNCRIKYKDEMNEVFLKETSVKYLIKNSKDYWFDAFSLTYIFIVNYNLWVFITELLNKYGFSLTNKYFNNNGENIL